MTTGFGSRNFILLSCFKNYLRVSFEALFYPVIRTHKKRDKERLAEYAEKYQSAQTCHHTMRLFAKDNGETMKRNKSAIQK